MPVCLVFEIASVLTNKEIIKLWIKTASGSLVKYISCFSFICRNRDNLLVNILVI